VEGRTLRFRNVTLTGSSEFQVERGFQLWDPYRQAFGGSSKPARCWVELAPGQTFSLDVSVAAQTTPAPDR
jgi:hypothetical protein